MGFFDNHGLELPPEPNPESAVNTMARARFERCVDTLRWLRNRHIGNLLNLQTTSGPSQVKIYSATGEEWDDKAAVQIRYQEPGTSVDLGTLGIPLTPTPNIQQIYYGVRDGEPALATTDAFQWPDEIVLSAPRFTAALYILESLGIEREQLS